MSIFAHIDLKETRSQANLDKGSCTTLVDGETTMMELPSVHPRDFPAFVPWACLALGVNILLDVSIDQYVATPTLEKANRKSMLSSCVKTLTPVQSAQRSPKKEKSESAIPLKIKKILVRLQVQYDNNTLVHLKLLQAKRIPRELFCVIGLALPFHPYLTGITIKSAADQYTCYELSKLLSISNITELSLDDSFIEVGNYDLLLENINRLRVLSLARCGMGDVVLEKICKKLEHPRPAARTLAALNVSSNRISDAGAGYIAKFLESNRTLSHLNLASNFLTDEGVNLILSTLKQFTIPINKELIRDRLNRFTKLRKKSLELTKTNSLKNITVSKTKIRRKSKPLRLRNKSSSMFQWSNNLSVPAKPATFPFQMSETVKKGNQLYSLGNNTLRSINFSYNHLTVKAVCEIIEVLKYQLNVNRVPNGLINIRLDGNFLSNDCEELAELDSLLKMQIDKVC